MKKIILVLLFAMAVSACKTTVPINNVSNAEVVGKPSLSQIKESIVEALKYKRWVPVSVEDKQITAEIWVRSHYAKISIDYDNESYSINYIESNNLDFDAGKNQIHRNYNKWIILLDQEIRMNIARRVL